MSQPFSTEAAVKLIGYCRDVDQARYLIENSTLLGVIHEVLTQPDARSRSEQELCTRSREALGGKLFLDDFRRHLDWFRGVGLWDL